MDDLKTGNTFCISVDGDDGYVITGYPYPLSFLECEALLATRQRLKEAEEVIADYAKRNFARDDEGELARDYFKKFGGGK